MASKSVGAVAFDLELNKGKFNSGIKDSAKGAESVLGAAMTKIGGYVAAAFSVAAVVKFTKTAVDAASQVQSAWTGLKSIADGSGKSFASAQKFINEYTKDGLVTINEAATAYKNLLSRGYDTTQIQNTMNALKDSAAFGRQASYQLGEAVVTATEGLKNENSILVDNAGVTKNVAKMWEEWAKAHNTTTGAMTQAQKIEAEYNGILKETQFQTGDAATYTKTFGGQLQMLKASFTNLKVAVGEVVAPIASLFIPIINTAIVAVTNFFNALKNVLAAFGLEFPEVVSKSTSSISNMGSSAVDAAEDIASTGGAAKKAAKEINKAFAGVDEIEVLNTSNKASGGGSAGGAGAGTSATATFESDGATSAVKKTSGVLDALMEKFKELKNLFLDGLDIGFKGASVSQIIKSVENIKKSIVGIFTDPKVLNATDNLYNTISYNLGRVVGSVGKIGTNIAAGLVEGINRYLSQNAERIKQSIVNLFSVEGELSNTFGEVFQSLGKISEVFSGDAFSNIWSDLLSGILNPVMSLLEIVYKLVSDVLKNVFKPLTDNADQAKETFEGFAASFEIVIKTISELLTTVGETLNAIYDNGIGPLLNEIGNGLSDTFSKLLEIYNKYVAPVVDTIATTFYELWDQHLKPVIEKIGSVVTKLFELIKTLWTTILKPLVDWIIGVLTPVIEVLMPVIEGLWKTITTVLGYLFDAIGGIMSALGGLIDFIIGVFTGDWDKAWEGIKTFFGGIWDAIKNIVLGVWEAIKGIIGTAINLVKDIIEKVFNGIKDFFTNIWTGIKNFIFSIWDGFLEKIDKIFPGMRNIIETVMNVIKTTISNILNSVKTVFTNIFDGIKDTVTKVINNVKNIISTGLNIVFNIFSNIFNSIWNTIRNICNFILGGIEGMVNGVIKGINKMVKALNGIKVTIPDWIPAVGGKSFGINLPTIGTVSLPRLANGGYVERNNPQLAIIGDNTREGEITAPESKIYDQVSKALKDNGGGVKELAITIYHKYEDGRTIIQKVNQAQIDAGEILLLT